MAIYLEKVGDKGPMVKNHGSGQGSRGRRKDKYWYNNVNDYWYDDDEYYGEDFGGRSRGYRGRRGFSGGRYEPY